MNFNPIMDALNGLAHLIWLPFQWLIDGIVTILWGVLYVVVDGLLSVVTALVSLIDISTLITNLTTSWGLLPSSVSWIIGQAGLAQALTIIGYAYIIRMTLNLIPATFTRL
jgi:hypothetical protein